MERKKDAPLEESKKDPPVSRKTNLPEAEKKFFLSWLNGVALSELIKEVPFQGDPRFPLNVPHLWYKSPKSKLGDETNPAVVEQDGMILFLNEADRDYALNKRQGFYSVNAIPGEENFVKAEKQVMRDRKRHRNFFSNFYDGAKLKYIPLIAEMLEKYNSLIRQEVNEDGFVEMRLINPVPRNLLAEIEVNFILRPALERNENILTGLRICESCGDFYFAGSNKSIYCSTRCRSREYRKRQKSPATE